MISKSMFCCDVPTIKEYRDMKLEDVLKEYLYTKGTWDDEEKPCNKQVTPKELCRSALWLYSLKDNPTNKTNVVYYCEKKAREMLWMRSNRIIIPDEIWNDCDAYNRKMCKRL